VGDSLLCVHESASGLRRNVRIYLRWGGDDFNRIRALGNELVGLKPDIVKRKMTDIALPGSRHAAFLSCSLAILSRSGHAGRRITKKTSKPFVFGLV
jgi:hypothetical protein